MFPDGSVSHPQGTEDEGDDEHADAGKKQVQQTMHHDAQDAQRQGRDHQKQKQDNHSIPRSVPMPVNTDDCLHVAGDGPRPGRACGRLALGFRPECPQISRIKRDVAYVDYHSAHAHRMAEHGWPGITQQG
jgi:hypothetical protein